MSRARTPLALTRTVLLVAVSAALAVVTGAVGPAAAAPARATSAVRPVTGLVAAPIDERIVVSWTAPKGVVGAVVRYVRGSTPPATRTSGTAAPTAPGARTATARGLTAATGYAFSVWAYDSTGAFSAPALVRSRTHALPGPVTGVRAAPVGDGHSVRLSWIAPASPDLSGVVVRRAVGSTPPSSPTAGTAVADVAVPALSYRDSGLAVGTSYAYALFAHDATGHVAPAATVLVRPLDPPALAGVALYGGAPLRNVSVTAVPLPGGTTLTARTDLAGRYALTAAQAGVAYTVCFDPAAVPDQPPGGLVGDCLPTSVTATAGRVVSIPDHVLAQGAALSGSVLSAASGNIVKGATVYVFDDSLRDLQRLVRVVPAGDDGRWTARGLPEVLHGYVVCADGAAASAAGAPGPFQPRCRAGMAWNGPGSTPGQGPYYPSSPGSVYSDVNVLLPPLNALTGRLSERLSGDGLANVSVAVFGSDGQRLAGDPRTDGTGAFRLFVTDGTYRVCYDTGSAFWNSQDIQTDAGFPDVCDGDALWSDLTQPAADATQYPLSGGATGVADTTIDAAGGVGGTLVRGGQPLVGTRVTLYTVGGAPVASAVSDSNGAYEISRQPPTSYLICAEAYAPGLGQGCWDGAAWTGWISPPPLFFDRAAPIGLSSGQLLSLDLDD